MRKPSVRVSLAFVVLFEWTVALWVMWSAITGWEETFLGSRIFAIPQILFSLCLLGMGALLIREHIRKQWEPLSFLHFYLLLSFVLFGLLLVVQSRISTHIELRHRVVTWLGVAVSFVSGLSFYLLNRVVWRSYRRTWKRVAGRRRIR